MEPSLFNNFIGNVVVSDSARKNEVKCQLIVAKLRAEERD